MKRIKENVLHFVGRYGASIIAGITIGSFIGIAVLLIQNTNIQKEMLTTQEQLTDISIDIDAKLDCMSEFFALESQDRADRRVLQEIENCIDEIRQQNIEGSDVF